MKVETESLQVESVCGRETEIKLNITYAQICTS